jgi:hypothetical protein
MEPIERPEFVDLAKRIREVYGAAYDAEPKRLVSDGELDRLVDQLWTVRSPDRVRRAIQGVVNALDDRLEQGS